MTYYTIIAGRESVLPRIDFDRFWGTGIRTDNDTLAPDYIAGQLAGEKA